MGKVKSQTEGYAEVIRSMRAEPGADIEFPNIGTGTLRTSSSIIALLLQFEDNPAEVIVDVAKALAITRDEINAIFDERPCELCGCTHDEINCP